VKRGLFEDLGLVEKVCHDIVLIGGVLDLETRPDLLSGRKESLNKKEKRKRFLKFRKGFKRIKA